MENGLLSPVTGTSFSVAESVGLHCLPGVNVAVINDFEIDWAQSYGVAETGRSAVVTPDTLSRLRLWAR